MCHNDGSSSMEEGKETTNRKPRTILLAMHMEKCRFLPPVIADYP